MPRIFRINTFIKNPFIQAISVWLAMWIFGCSSSAEDSTDDQTVQKLPVLTIRTQPATTFQDFASKLEGKVNVEIRPRVEGYLEKIFVDEGAYVNQGQSLFKINEDPYREQLSNASASLQA